MTYKTAPKTLAYTNKNEINKEIGLAYIVLGKRKAIKKFLNIDKTSIIYIEKIQGV